MAIGKKMVGIGAAGVAIALALTGCAGGGDAAAGGGSSDAPREVLDVNFGYIADFNGTSLLAVAEDQGLWEKYGLNVTTTSFTNGPLQIQAIGAGDLDYGYIGPGAMWLPASGQTELVAINTLGNADRVIAQPDSGIESLKDLQGKTIAIPEGTSGDMILTLALESVGLSKDDVNIVPMDPATVVSAFAAQQVDAAGIWYPAIDTIKQQVPDLVELAKNEDFADTVSFPTAFVSNVNPDEQMTVRVLGALREAIAFRADNMDETIQLTADMLQITPQQVESDAANVEILTLEELDSLTQDGTIEQWLSGMNEYFIGAGRLTANQALEPSEFYRGDLFLQAGE